MNNSSILKYFSPKSSKTVKINQNSTQEQSHEKEDVVNKPSFSSKSKKRRSILEECEENNIPIKINNKQNEIDEESIAINSCNTTIDISSFGIYNSNYERNIIKREKENNQTDIHQETTYPHNSYKFLMPQFIRDKEGHSYSDPEYNHTTLQLPSGFLTSKETTPAMKQWWKVKSDNFDCVLFFKVGKFYELYHMDADVGVKELSLTYMKGKFAHAGFPETSFAMYASTLVEKGYKVARVEQTEKPSDLLERNKVKTGTCSVEKVVRRDLCNIMSSSTRIFDSFDVEVDSNSIRDDASLGFGLMLSVAENYSTVCDKNSCKLGVCILDTSIASFTLSEFQDDRSLSKLRTLLAHYSIPVVQVIASKGTLSDEVYNKLKKCVGSAKIELINTACSPERTIKDLLANNYFLPSSDSTQDPSTNANCRILSSFPTALSELINVHNKTNSPGMALSAFGTVIYVLKRHLIDERVIPVGTFTIHTMSNTDTKNKPTLSQTHMVIDDTAMRNLDVVSNSEGYIGKYGTILGLLNHCVTPFGRRHMVNLVCHPLYNKIDIDDRLDVVETFISLGNSELDELRKYLSDVSDLERLLVRLHSTGTLHYSINHPQNRAILFNQAFFNKKKIDDLISVVVGFEKCFSFYQKLKNYNFNCKLLDKLLNFQLSFDQTTIESLESLIQMFSDLKKSFDFSKAKKDGDVIPHVGFIPEYDAAVVEIAEIQTELNEYLSHLKSKFQCNNIKYWGSDSSRYLIEIPTSVNDNLIPDNFELKSQRKGFKRYASEKSQEILTKILSAEDKKNTALRNVFILLVEKILPCKSQLLCFISHLSMIDCLLAFTQFSSGCVTNAAVSRPIVVESDRPIIEIKGGYHPCLAVAKSNIVSNDMSLGIETQNYNTTLLITGPNMGGKSTLMRQTAIIIILAQLGCYVPCVSCRFTPVDRVFARLGASFDHPNTGESTFFVELAETAVMIKSATPKSLILLDELGRGTATHDGLSIAFSVLKYICQQINCITIFSTHYHYIARELEMNPGIPITTAYMECLVHHNQDGKQSADTITFLYRIKRGVCPNSYGFHVARLAGIPNNVVERAVTLANQMERYSLINELYQIKNNDKKIDIRGITQRIAAL